MIALAPALEVIMITVLEKSTFLPCESVICPSSSTCRSTLNTSGCAFSISSNRMTEYGCVLTWSLSCPPSSCPTYPGGEPIILETECFSIYSDMSTRIMASSLPNNASASALESSVFPTPVGPRNRKEPIGRFGSLSPTLPRFTARVTALTASSWPITLLWSTFSRFFRRSASLSPSFCTGTFVQTETTSAISFSVTDGCIAACFFSNRFFTDSSFFSAASCSFWSRDASLKSPFSMLSSFWRISSWMLSSSSLKLSGIS